MKNMQCKTGVNSAVRILLFYRTCILNSVFFVQYEILLQKNSGRPLRGLCILWSIGQAGLGSLANGLKGILYFDYMMKLV